MQVLQKHDVFRFSTSRKAQAASSSLSGIKSLTAKEIELLVRMQHQALKTNHTIVCFTHPEAYQVSRQSCGILAESVLSQLQLYVAHMLPAPHC